MLYSYSLLRSLKSKSDLNLDLNLNVPHELRSLARWVPTILDSFETKNQTFIIPLSATINPNFYFSPLSNVPSRPT